LIAIHLQHNSIMNSWLMLSLMLFCVIWMNRMCHICWYEKTFPYCSFHILIRSIFMYTFNNSFCGYIYNITISSLCRTWSNFLMIKKHNHTYFFIVFVAIQMEINNRINRTKTACHIIKSWRWNKFFMKTNYCWLIEIISTYFKINNLIYI
jgi:hypothetical protein